MRFRFTITRSAIPIDPFPELSEWESDAFGLASSTVVWQGLGTSSPYAEFGSGITSSEYLYTDYDFVAGLEYTIEVQMTRVEDSMSPANPRTFTLSVFDNFNVVKVYQSFAASPGTSIYSITFTATNEYTKFGMRFTSGSARTVTIDSLTPVLPTINDTSYRINEPDGWRDSTLKLERDKIFHSLIEHFEGSFIFYGSNDLIDGGYHHLKDWDEEDGPDADITLLIEYADDNVNFFELFSGQLDMSLAEWMVDNKVRIPIIKDSFWATFMNRKETPVNLIADEDLDDNDVENIDDIAIDLPSQKIRYNGEYNWLDSFTYEFDEYNIEYAMQVDWDETIVDDLRKFNLPRAMVLDPGNDGVNTGENIVGIFEAPWDGDYAIDIEFPFAFYNEDDDEWRSVASVNFWMHGINDLPTADDRFDRTADSNGDDSWNIFSLQRTFRASKGQQFKIYGTFGGPVVSGDLPRYTIFGERRLIWHNAALATTSSITLSGEQNIDGTMTSGTVVLVRAQGDSSLNGLYTSAAGAWTRHADMNTESEFINAAVYVTGGDDNAGTAWRQSETEIELGSTAITWVYLLPNDERLRPFPETVDNHFNITADTTFRKTRVAGFLLHDAGAAIINHYGLGEPNPFYSEVLGSDRTLARQYENNGCFWAYGLTRGLQLRGYSLNEKSFAMSFMEWWQGADPIFNLGLGYEYLTGGTIDGDSAEVADLADWENAGGLYPGAWTYTSPALPQISVAGDGGTSGYAKGACATVGGNTYLMSFVLQIEFTSPVDVIVTVAILDASDNEVGTTTFTYASAGFKHEVFEITPSADGTSVAMRIQNNTVAEAKVFSIRYFVGSNSEQILLNSDFDDTSVWIGDGTGFPWVISGGEAEVTMPNTNSERLLQLVTDAPPGKYLFVVKRTSSDFAFGVDSSNLLVYAYDNVDNPIDGIIEFISASNTSEYSYGFETSVAISRIRIRADVNSGADITVAIDYVKLYGMVENEPIFTPAERRIRVEKREYFFDPSPNVYLSNIRDITRRYDTEKIYKKILIGYKTWKTEDISGIDDPQTKHTYATQLKKAGEEVEILSDFIAASLAIEQARRQSIDKSTDYQFDDNTFIIALNTDDTESSPDAFIPETSENFTVINNLLNSETRYNIRLTPKRSFLRHINWLNIGLQSYVGSLYRFTRGEGNYDVETAMLSSCEEEDYDSAVIAEDDNLLVTTDTLHSVYYYEIGYKMSLSEYRGIVANRNKAIGVSQTDFGHIPFFIDNLQYKLAKGELQISGWTKEYWDITQVPGITPSQSCTIFIPCENAITDENQHVLADEEGNCIVWTL